MAALTDPDRCIKFNLFDLCNQDLKKLLENVENEKACIVSVIGKTSLSSPEFKTSIIAEALGKNLHQPNEKRTKHTQDGTNCDITGYYDSKSRVVFLNFYGISDTSCIIQTCKNMETELKEKSFLELWCDLQYHYAKTLLMLFSISHIIIVVHPNASFDLSYIYLFRTLDAIRFKAQPWLVEQLKSLDISGDWIQAGRPCSPRVLFVFESCPLNNLTKSSISSSMEGNARLKAEKVPRLIKLGHSLEDQIYRLLRKSRVITNISGNSLFAVPANQEFVYIFSSKPYIADPVGFFLNQIRLHCQFAKQNDSTLSRSKNGKTKSPSPVNTDSTVAKSKSSKMNNSSLGNGSIACAAENTDDDDEDEQSFGKFLQQHIKLAHTKGFDDNVGRHPIPAYFELPFVHTWFELASKLGSGIGTEPKDGKSRVIHSALKTALDIDVRFSEVRCAKVLPIASAAYQDNLPIHYTEEYHQTRLAHAIQVFTMHARGPAYQRYVQQLKEDCERLWKSGHQMCEFLSLTGNHCINQSHRTDDDDDDIEEDKTLPVMSHCSQVKLVSSCDCGRKQATREDPFEVKEANRDFYMIQMAHCCGEMERIEFPVFQASTSESHPAHISPIHVPLTVDAVEEKAKELSSANNSSHGSNVLKTELSAENSEESSVNEVEQTETDDQSQSQAEEGRDEIIISIQDGNESTSSKEKTLTRQPSTTEYLPGMLHSESPPGLLPVFSSWSLVCLGPSSLYSHNIGLQDQPGFIPGTNFLLPWDVTVKVEHKERWPALWEGKRPLGMKAKKAIRDGPQFNVKIFIGVEYECHRGHRFMCSAPDRVLRVTSTGLVKDNALKVTGCDMPLYFPCPCRSSKPQIAQLMRIHVVTPKAPVHVTLNPRVQPAPDPCPIFFPTINEPLKLSQSAYWVLRLPFVYEGDQGSYLPPREPMPVETCRLLKGTYNIAEQQSNR